MFRYGFEKAVELSDPYAGELIVSFPKQTVIFLEENQQISEILGDVCRTTERAENVLFIALASI
jgi:hypothetical protein